MYVLKENQWFSKTQAHLTEEDTVCLRGVTLTWRDLSVYAMDRGRKNMCKQLINNVKGAAKPGDLTAIIGASGAGKSSLMAALAFRTGPELLIHGDIRANGTPVDSSYMMHNSGYMHQEDIFVATMTVIEHLWFMARMKLDGRVQVLDIRRKIDSLLRDVGLTSRRDVRIGSSDTDDKVLSGGEKKRLSFATELLTDPKILFLDEPTTGQDSHSANCLISQLKSFAAKGRTVLCTIHQPSSTIFSWFDRIILIAEGRVAFAGGIDQAVEFFASQGYECPRKYNPADFLIAIVATGSKNENGEEIAHEICDVFSTSKAYNEIDRILETQMQSMHSVNSRSELLSDDKFITRKEARYCSRLYWLIYRHFLQVLRDPSVQIIRILQKVSVATIAGLCFVGAVNFDQLGIQATQGVIFILVSENAFFPMYATLALIPQELPLLRREYRAGMYPVYLYYAARILSLIPGLIIEPLLFATIIYWLAGLRDNVETFGFTLLVLLLTINVSTACGCFFSTAFESVPLAMAYLIPFDYILMITMGPFLKLGSLPLYIQWIKYISWLLHSSEALSILQWNGVHNISCETTDPELPCITEGIDVLHRYDFDETNFWMDMLSMIVIYLVFHILACVCLWNRCRCK